MVTSPEYAFSLRCARRRDVLRSKRQDLHIPKCRASFAQRSFRYRAVKLRNAIPSHVKDSPTLNTFKTLNDQSKTGF